MLKMMAMMLMMMTDEDVDGEDDDDEDEEDDEGEDEYDDASRVVFVLVRPHAGRKRIEHIPKHHLSPLVWVRVISNLQLIDTTGD